MILRLEDGAGFNRGFLAIVRGVGRPEARADRKAWGDMNSKNLRLSRRSCFCLLALATGLLFGGLFIGCGPTAYPSMPTGRLKIILGKTPTPLQPLKQATLTVSRVEVLREREALDQTITAGMLALSQSAEPTDDGWIVVQEREEILDLLEIAGGNKSVFINAEIPEGRYTHLRVTCRRGCVTLGQSPTGQAEQTFVIEVGRGKAREVALDCDFRVTAGRETALLLNVDINQAFQPVRGNGIQGRDRVSGFQFVPRQAIHLIDLPSAETVVSTPNTQASRSNFGPT